MKQSELNEQATRQTLTPKQTPIMMGDMLGGDQYLRPEWRSRIEQGDRAMQSLSQAHTLYRNAATGLQEALRNVDPEVTPDAHFMKTRQLGEQLLTRAAGASDTSRAAAEGEVKALQHKLRADLGLVESHRAGEIRTMLRSLPDAKRQELLQAAIAEQDAQTVAAVIEGPAYLSGITAGQAKALKLQYERAHGGDIPARIDTLQKAIEVNRKTALEALAFHEKLFPADRAAQIAAKQKTAKQMRDKLAATGI